MSSHYRDDKGESYNKSFNGLNKYQVKRIAYYAFSEFHVDEVQTKHDEKCFEIQIQSPRSNGSEYIFLNMDIVKHFCLFWGPIFRIRIWDPRTDSYIRFNPSNPLVQN